MKMILRFLCVIALSSAIVAQDTVQLGIEVSDLNRKVSACDDFFEYSNGAWRAANPIPDSMSRWSRRWAAGETTKDKLREILESVTKAKSGANGSVDQLTGDFYSACMNESQANRLGIQPIKKLLSEIDAIKSPLEVQQMIARFHAISIPVPFGLYGGSDNHEPNDVIAHIYASGLGLPDRDYYVKTESRFKEAREKYLLYVAKVFGLAGFNEALAKAAADAIFQMELQFAQASLDNVALRDPKATDNMMSPASLQKLAPNFDWKTYQVQLGIRIGDLNVFEPRFLEEFNRQLTSTPINEWKTYLKWHLLRSSAPSLSDAFVNADFEFYEAFLGGAKAMKPRWKRCVEQTDSLLGEALGRKYVEKYFPPAAKTRMQEMVKNLLAAMGEAIQSLEWMSDATKKRALEKLSTFDPKIGYPDKWKDYSRVPITRASYWDNVVAGRIFGVVDNVSTIGKPVDRGLWGMTPPTSNAYYNASLNEIVFPAGILQPPAFNMSASDAVNYGAIGAVIGHEISHGFDDGGAQYDAQGRLKNWWTDEDLKTFQLRSECIVDQYNNYFVEPGLHQNGKLVLGESIGDIAGVKIAFRALQISRRGKPSLPTIDGFTPEQQFFIAWGQFRGDAVRPEFARTMVQGHPHPIGKYRVIGSVSNMPDFQQAFACPIGSSMVRPPEKRCSVW